MEERRRRNISAFARYLNLRWLVSLSGQKTIFPFYHVVSDTPRPHIRHLYYCRDEKAFESDLEEILKLFAPISIEDYLEGKRGPGKGRQMVLSFDDGLVECHQVIAPLLRKRGIPALFFLNNSFIDNRGLFFRYRASILIEHLSGNAEALSKAAEFLAIPEKQVKDAILMITYRQRPLLEALLSQVELDESSYQREQPIYMSAEQVRELAEWGFHLGAHSMDHPEFHEMEEEEMVEQVSRSMQDLKKRFQARLACFAFPFTSDGVPERVIERLLDEKVADFICGTAGLKRTGRKEFVQRIPMEGMDLAALSVLKTEYFYYLLKAPLRQNLYFKSR